MRECFPGAQIEGHAVPAPVFHETFECDIGFGFGIGMNSVLAAISWDRRAMGCPFTVLGSNGDVFNILIGNRPETAEDFHFRVAHHIRIERVGGLHRHQAEELQHVILHHVTQCAGFFVITRSGPDAFRFAYRDLHMIDILVVPDRLEDAVGEPDDHQVLNRFFP